jgi:hypothetical protein
MWTCVEILWTGSSENELNIRVMFDGRRPNTIVSLAATEKMGLRASGKARWQTSEG